MNSSNNQIQSKITLWGVKVSPYVRKVMIALAEKNIPYEQKETLPKKFLLATGQSVPAEFEKISPLGKIPALQVDNFAITDSAVIAAYLEHKFPNTPALFPTNPEDYARALWFENYADTIMTDVIYKKIFLECVAKPKVLNVQTDTKLVEETTNNELPTVLDFLDKKLAQHEWIAGSQFSIGDIAITTQLLALTMSGYEIKQKKLQEFLQKMKSRSSLQALGLK